jgi:hypothetical protein
MEAPVKMDFGVWRVELVGPRHLGRYGCTVTLKNNWMTLTNDFGGWRAWTHRGAVRKGQRLLECVNRDEALRDSPEMVT